MKRFIWTKQACQLLRDHYADRSTSDVAAIVGNGCSTRACYQKANSLGLRKSTEYLESSKSGRLLRGVRRSPDTEFKPGHVPANKGQKMTPELYAKCAPTMFKKGELQGAARHNYKPIGSMKITRDGQLVRKVTDDPELYPSRRWVPVSRLVWEAANGPVPAGHIVRFKDGMHTTAVNEITIDRLECITKAENMRRNTIHNLPPELADTSRLIGRVTRQINKRAKNEKQA